jgi:hypothetical protein
MLPLSKLPNYIIRKNANNRRLINTNKHGIYHKSDMIYIRTPIICIKFCVPEPYGKLRQIYISHKIYDSFYRKRKFVISSLLDFKTITTNGYYHRYIRKGLYIGKTKSLFHKQLLYSLDSNVKYCAYMTLNGSTYNVRIESFDRHNQTHYTYKIVDYDIKTHEPVESRYWLGYNIRFFKYDDNHDCNKKTIIEIKRYIDKLGAYKTYV